MKVGALVNARPDHTPPGLRLSPVIQPKISGRRLNDLLGLDNILLKGFAAELRVMRSVAGGLGVCGNPEFAAGPKVLHARRIA